MKYRKISPCIWNDAKVRELSDKGKLALLFLLTHPHMPLPDGRLPCGARSASHPFPHQAPYPAGHPAGLRAGHPAPQRAERPFPSSGSFPGGPLLEGHPQREGFLSCWSA